MAGKGGKGTGHRLFIANLPYSVDWKYLKDLFRDNGIDVRHADIQEEASTGRSKGNAVVEVGSREDLEQAIDLMNEMEVDGRNIIVREDREVDGGPKGKGKGKGKADREDRDHSKADGKGKGRPPWHALPDEPPRPTSRRDYDRQERFEPQEWRGDGRDVRHEQPGGARIFVEKLPQGFPWQQVKDLCRSVGLRVRHADIFDAEMGIAVVELFDEAEVQVAMDHLHGMDVEGRRIRVRPEHGRGGKGGKGKGGYKSRDGGYADESWDRGDRRGGYAGGKGPSRGEDWGDRPRGGKGAREREPPEEPHRGKRPPPSTDEDAKSRRLFAENLDPSMDWKQIKDLFKGYFDVIYADVLNVGGDSFGIIEFQSRSDALEACMQFNGVLLEGRAVRLRQDRGEFHEMRANNKRQRTGEPDTFREHDERPKAYHPPEGERARKGGGGGGGTGGRPPGGPRVFVGNLDFKIEWQDLKDHMRQAGNVRFCDVLKDREGKPKGCGIVEFSTEEECEIAMETLNDSELGTRQIYIRWAEDGGRR